MRIFGIGNVRWMSVFSQVGGNNGGGAEETPMPTDISESCNRGSNSRIRSGRDPLGRREPIFRESSVLRSKVLAIAVKSMVMEGLKGELMGTLGLSH